MRATSEDADRPPKLCELAAVVPTLDEEATLEATLTALAPEVDEIVVSDGGSRDGTILVARRLDVRVVAGTAGRGPQLNAGARVADARALLFVHADTQLPPGAGAAIRRALDAGAVGGGFGLRFDRRSRGLAMAAALINARTRLTGLPLGDQAQFVRRDVFDRLEGYRPWPILEDLDFARRLRRAGTTVILPEFVVTSARRYARGGLLRTATRNWTIWCLFALGVPPTRLARLYRTIR